MKRQRNTAQMKEQIRNTQVQINGEEISKLPGKEFRIMIVKMIQNLENGENARINKDLGELKNKHTNNTIIEIKNILEGIKRIYEIEECMSELEDKMMKIIFTP